MQLLNMLLLALSIRGRLMELSPREYAVQDDSCLVYSFERQLIFNMAN
jgi:hypothetical protein